jgi:outer membrane murein-binding lipoprotein Lpp
MTPEERWEKIEEKHAALAESVEILAGMQDAADARLIQLTGNVNRLTVHVNKIATNVSKLVDTVAQLAGLVRSHEERINRLEGGEAG